MIYLSQAVTNDVIELRRIADIMVASEHYAKDSVKERLKKVNAKYSKFKAALEKRKIIVTSSVAMYKGITEVCAICKILRVLYKCLFY